MGIGINKYRHFPPLHNAVKDVEALRDIMQSKYDVTNVTTTMLIDEQATEDNIDAELRRFNMEIQEGDKLMIYYSGNGLLDEMEEEGNWIPVDARQGKFRDYITDASIINKLKSCPAQHVLLIADSCYSGSLFPTKRGTPNISNHIFRQLHKRKSRWAICSGRENEEVADGRVGSNSPFAKSLLDFLTYGEESLFNAGALVQPILFQTSYNSRIQTPIAGPLAVAGDELGQYIFRKKGSESIEWSPPSEGEKGTPEPEKITSTAERSPEPIAKRASSVVDSSKAKRKIQLILGAILIGIVILVILYFAFWS